MESNQNHEINRSKFSLTPFFFLIKVIIAESFLYHLLYHLSYIPFTTEKAGIEPAT